MTTTKKPGGEKKTMSAASKAKATHDLMEMVANLHDVKGYKELNWEGSLSDYLHITLQGYY